MKKHISIVILVAMLIVAVFPMTAFAADAGASLTGPRTVRAGDTITVSFALSGSDIYGVSGTLSYDRSQLTLVRTAQQIASPWVVEFNGNAFVAYDNNLSAPINGSKTIFTATFTVKNVEAGTSIKVACNGVTASDGSADTSIGAVTYAATIVAPLSTNNNLGSLVVEDAVISPAFSAGTTSYTVSVPYEVSHLRVSAEAADYRATVTVDSPELIVNGTTTVSVTVTAENGATKTYTIFVARAQDPNYVPSGNNNLAGISVDGFMISPGFNPEIHEYVVWLPYEVDSISVSGSPDDSNASVEVVGGTDLVAGEDNIVKVICASENGEQKEYTVIAKRAAEHGAEPTRPAETEPEETEPAETKPTETEPTNTEPTETKPTETVPVETQPSDNDKDTSNQNQNTGIAWWWLIVVALVAFTIGGVCGYLFKNNFGKNHQ